MRSCRPRGAAAHARPARRGRVHAGKGLVSGKTSWRPKPQIGQATKGQREAQPRRGGDSSCRGAASGEGTAGNSLESGQHAPHSLGDSRGEAWTPGKWRESRVLTGC